MTHSVRICDMIADRYDYLKPRGTITAEFNEKNGVHVLTFCLDDFYKETIRLSPSGAYSPSPTIYELDSTSDNSFQKKKKKNFKMCSDSISDLVQRLWYLWSLERNGTEWPDLDTYINDEFWVFSTFSHFDWFYHEIKTGNLTFNPANYTEHAYVTFDMV